MKKSVPRFVLPFILPCLWVALFATSSFADPPPGYYEAANGLTGPALKSALNEIIKNGHTVIPYDGLFGPLRAVWRDPSNSNNILLFYSNESVSRNSNAWNREHLWPRSRGVSTDGGPDDSDLFHVVPCDADVNGARGNLYFDLSSAADGGIVNPAHPEAPLCTRDDNSWQPQPAQRGDVARALFYMATRYDGRDAGTTDLALVEPAPGPSQMANLDTLLAWHAADPPDAIEMGRNELIFSTYQHNRNPFIDHPEWVSAIWGGAGAGRTAQVQAADASAVESPNSTGAFLIQLSNPASGGGLAVSFSMSGTASTTDYTLSVTGPASLDFNPIAGAGTLTIPANASSASIIVTPTTDGAPELPELVQLTILSAPGYAAIGGTAMVTISDQPPPPPPGAIATWDFNAASFSKTSPIPATSGAGTLHLDEWDGSVDSFSGYIGQSLALIGSGGNGSHIDFEFSALGYRDLSITFYTRGTATGFNLGTWSWSTDGLNFTTLPGVNTATRDTSFDANGEVLVDFSGVTALNHIDGVTLRYTLAGASSTGGNNRLDEMVVHATPIPRISVVASDATAKERNANPATFVLASDVLAGDGGLAVEFNIGGKAKPGADYLLTGATNFNTSTGVGTVTIPPGEASIPISIVPIADTEPTEFDETVSIQIEAVPGLNYVVGASSSAQIVIEDDTPYSAAWAARYPGFNGVPTVDSDGDGLENFAESFFNRNPVVDDPVVLTGVGADPFTDPSDGSIKTFATFTYLRRTDTGVLDHAEIALSLDTWTDDVVLVSTVPGQDPMTEIVKWRGIVPLDGSGAGPRQFFRVRLTIP